MISGRPDCKVSSTDLFTLVMNSPFNLKQFEANKILLTENKKWWPKVIKSSF